MKALRGQGRLAKLLAAFSILVAVFAVYFPGLNGPFVFDDEIHIRSDPEIRMSVLNAQSLANAIFLEDGSLTARPIAKISLAFNYFLSVGTAGAFGYKLTNLAIHLLNTSMVYWFSFLLLVQYCARSPAINKNTLHWTALLVAALWALHPLHLTTVLYVVQRMTSLATFFVLAGLIFFIHGRRRIQEKKRLGYAFMAVGAIGGSVLGLACKENAVVLLPLMLVIESIFFNIKAESSSDRNKLILFYSLTVVMPAIMLSLWLIFQPDFILDAYLAREFTLIERLLTEARVLWIYVGLLFFPDAKRFALFHDDIPISTGFFDPWTTSLAILPIFSVILLAILARRRYPFFSFAVLWFLVGHSIESSVIGLEIAHEHRNYLPDIGILLAAGYGLTAVALRFQKYVRYAITLAPVLTLGFITHTMAYTWASEEGIIESLARHHPDSARGQYMLAELYAEKKQDFDNALLHYRKAAKMAPHETGYIVKSVITAAKIDTGLGKYTQAASYTAENSDLIGHQLKNKPVTPSTLHILEQLTNCTNQSTELCKRIYPNMKSWYTAVVQNPHIDNKVRRNFIVYLFNLGTERPDLNLSLEAAKWGMKFEPSNPVYGIMEANVYLLRGDLEMAEDQLKMVAKNFADELTDEMRKDTAVLVREIYLRKSKLRTPPNYPK
jgi:tetratricopeptide (TPR) repeat protein